MDFDIIKEKELGHGSFGTCYLIGDNMVVKVFNPDKIKTYETKLVGIHNDTYIFPYKIVFYSKEKKRPLATFSKYIHSKPIEQQDILIYDLINSIDKVYSDTILISEMGIKTSDVRCQNMLYDNSIRIIDPDFYTFTTESIRDLINYNIAEFNYGVLKFLIDNPKIIAENKYLLNLYSKTVLPIDNNMQLKEFLIALCEYISSYLKRNVYMLSEIKDFTRHR